MLPLPQQELQALPPPTPPPRAVLLPRSRPAEGGLARGGAAVAVAVPIPGCMVNSTRPSAESVGRAALPCRTRSIMRVVLSSPS